MSFFFSYDANELWGFSLQVPIWEKDQMDFLGLKGHPLSRQKFKTESNSQEKMPPLLCTAPPKLCCYLYWEKHKYNCNFFIIFLKVAHTNAEEQPGESSFIVEYEAQIVLAQSHTEGASGGNKQEKM